MNKAKYESVQFRIENTENGKIIQPTAIPYKRDIKHII